MAARRLERPFTEGKQPVSKKCSYCGKGEGNDTKDPVYYAPRVIFNDDLLEYICSSCREMYATIVVKTRLRRQGITQTTAAAHRVECCKCGAMKAVGDFMVTSTFVAGARGICKSCDRQLVYTESAMAQRRYIARQKAKAIV